MSGSWPVSPTDVAIALGVSGFLWGAWRLLAGAEQRKRQERRLQRARQSSGSGQHMAERRSLRRYNPAADASLVARLTAAFAFTRRLRGRLEFAGMDATPEKYLTICAGLMLLVCGLLSGLFGKPLALGALTGFALGFGLPHLYLGRRIASRKRRFLKLFPDAINLIVRGLRAGLPVAKSMQTVSTEIADPVSGVFREMVEQIAVGINMEQAMLDMAKRLGITEFNFFVTSIVLQRETGGNLAEILANLADVLRMRHMMQMKVHAMSSEARASAYIVGALPFLVFAALNVISPNYVEPLYSDFRGNLGMAAAAGMLGMGGFVMARMARVGSPGTELEFAL